MPVPALVGAVVPIVGKLLNKFLTNKGDKAKLLGELELKLAEQETKLIEALVSSDIAQSEVNKIDAQSDSGFKSYARPSAMWICVIGFGFSIVLPYISWILQLSGVEIPTPPPLPSEVLNTMLFGLLGLGAYRSYDKTKGVTK
jgi:hypothetical protein